MRPVRRRGFTAWLFWRRLLAEDAGTEILEIALSLPVLLMTTVGAVEVLLFMTSFVGATCGSRMAVRYAATHGASSLSPCNAASLTSMVQSYMVLVPGGRVTVTPAWTPSNLAGSTVTVQVSVTFPTGIPYARLSTMSAATTASGVIVQ